MKFIFVCACGKQRNPKHILSLSPELVNLGGYDFPHTRDGNWNSHLFFKRPFVDIAIDMPRLQYRKL